MYATHILLAIQAFTMATGRVLYKADWSLSRPDICERNGWSKSFGGEARRFTRTEPSPCHTRC